MKTKRLLSVTILLLAALTIYANPRSKQAIAKAAAEVLNSSTNNNRIKRSPRKDKLVELQSNDVVTIMGYQSGGYAIIGNDDRLPLVIGYSTNSKFMKDSNTSFDWYLEVISDSIKQAINLNKNISQQKSNKKVYNAIGPFLKSQWGQGKPFNDLCPIMDSLGTRALTGCVATAMAQIIYYNKYPKEGKGAQDLYYWREDNHSKIYIGRSFNGTFYNYSQMKDDYSGDYDDKEANAVATLMRDCGIAAKMSYGSTSSGAYIIDAYNALKQNFRYSDSLQLVKKVDFEEDDWSNAIYAELNEGRVILYKGSSGKESHAFVLDGYDAKGYIHINWGWDGWNNGFYDLSLIPYSKSTEMIIGNNNHIVNKDVASINVVYKMAKNNTSENRFNILGQKVSNDYKGIIIYKGKKYFNK